MTLRRHLGVAALIVLVAASGAFAQGSQTGALSGTVQSSDKQPLPGVTVTVKSPALLGVRTAVTDTNGGYIFKGLPSGDYKVSFELSGFGTQEKNVTVAVGGNVRWMPPFPSPPSRRRSPSRVRRRIPSPPPRSART